MSAAEIQRLQTLVEAQTQSIRFTGDALLKENQRANAAEAERDTLAAQLAEAVGALKPFVKLYEAYDAQARFERADSDIFFNDMFYEVDVDGPYAKVTFGDFREAARILRALTVSRDSSFRTGEK